MSDKRQTSEIIGLIGGMSYASTVSYYELINELAIARWGGQSRARVLISSVDFAAIEAMQAAGEWERAGQLLAAEARRLLSAGASVIGLCTNTMHKCAAAIAAECEGLALGQEAGAAGAKFIHIAHAAAAECERMGLSKILLLGTRYTMEEGFLREQLGTLQVLTPDAADRVVINEVIFSELCAGVVRGESREKFEQIVRKAAAAGAQGVLLACTEIALLCGSCGEFGGIKIIDTTTAHAHALFTAACE